MSTMQPNSLLPASSYAFMSNNGLRVTGRTSQSVDLAWSTFAIVQQKQPVVSTEDADESCEEVSTSEILQEEDVKEDDNWYDVQMRKGDSASDWTSIYKGYGYHCIINGLPPDSVVVFRMKQKKDVEWGSEVIASTDPSPPTTMDLNRAVEMNSEYLVTRILGNAKRGHLRQLLAAHDSNGMTPLMVACHNGNVAIAEKLLGYGCNINAVSTGTRRTSLMFACIMGRLNVAKLLDKHRVDWRIRDKCTCSAMDYAINGGHMALVQLAYSRLGRSSVLEKDLRGWTPLMRAVIISKQLDIIKFLLHHGANPNDTDGFNSKSVLMAAILAKKPVFVKYLLGKGANPFYENSDGKNCFQIAQGLEYREIKEILREHKKTMAKVY